MRFFLPLAALSLAATGTAAGTASTFGQLVQEFPKCAQQCAVQLYHEAFANSCGQNFQSSSMKCVCSVHGSMSAVQTDTNKLASCVQQSCKHLTSGQGQMLYHASSQLAQICTSYSQSGGSSSNAAPSLDFSMHAAMGLVGLTGMLMV